MIGCVDCSEEYGPCEAHGETMVSREGSSLRTGDELAALYVSDALALGAELSPWGKAVRERVATLLALHTSPWGGAWLPTDAPEGDELGTLVSQMETEVYTLGYLTYWDDGYRVVRATGGPLADHA